MEVADPSEIGLDCTLKNLGDSIQSDIDQGRNFGAAVLVRGAEGLATKRTSVPWPRAGLLPKGTCTCRCRCQRPTGPR
jgi:hypothetical protein